jgi:hypothetical protein
MLLSDAIRVGCEVTKKSRWGARAAVLSTRTACVLGAALLTTRRSCFSELSSEWPCLNMVLPSGAVPDPWRCSPADAEWAPPRTLMHHIVYASDGTSASREAIAEWVDYLHETGVIDARHRSGIELLQYVDAGLVGLAPEPPSAELPPALRLRTKRPTRRKPARRP